MTTLRLERVRDGDLDRAIAELPSIVLVRVGDLLLADLVPEVVERANRAFAFAGVRATAADALRDPDRALVRAAGRTLAPLPGLVAYDRVEIRALTLAEATAYALRRSPWWRRERSRAARCASLLRGADACVAWERSAWGRARALRSRDARRALRPLVFERAIAHRERVVFASSGTLAAWAFA